MPDAAATQPFSIAEQDAIVPPEHHRMLGGSRVTGRLLCSCGKVIVSWDSDTWGVHLADVWADGWEAADGDAPFVAEREPEPEPRGMSEASRQAWRAERGIPEMPREQIPSRQDRRDEYDHRNAKRRRERAVARQDASVVSSNQSGTP